MTDSKFGVAAFTIVEALVGMLVSAIILAVVFLIFTITSDRLYDFKQQNSSISDVNRMMYSINKSIFDSSEMTVEADEVVFKSYTGAIARYRLSENFFVRSEHDFIDTFQIKVNAVKLDVLKSASGKEIYQRLKWSIVAGNKRQQLSFYKKFDASAMINSIEK